MPTLDDFYEPTIEPILDSNESSNALSPKPLDNLRNPSTHPTHRNHLDHKEDREEQHQWLNSIKNQYAITIECVDEAYMRPIRQSKGIFGHICRVTLGRRK